MVVGVAPVVRGDVGSGRISARVATVVSWTSPMVGGWSASDTSSSETSENGVENGKTIVVVNVAGTVISVVVDCAGTACGGSAA